MPPKGGEIKMRKKIILLAVSAVLLLFFASSSYGELDPKYVLRAHTWNEADLSSPQQDTTGVSYYNAATNNRTICIRLVKILGCNIVLIRDRNSTSLIKSLADQPSSFKKNER
jgi:hypothetical protein